MSENWTEDVDRIRAIGPRHILFLCISNAARSQIAAAIARGLAPGLRASSAGARPTALHPLAVDVLADLGIDIRNEPSRRLEDIPPEDVDVVITLCDDDVGAMFPGKAPRFHWPLPDPTKVTGDEATRREAFRSLRDELMRRLALVFLGRSHVPPVQTT